jgi:hypothetical protein
MNSGKKIKGPSWPERTETGQGPMRPAPVLLKLSARNYFEIVSSFLFLFLGLIILYRSIIETSLFLGMVVGALFLGYGIFRLRYIWNFFPRKGEKR